MATSQTLLAEPATAPEGHVGTAAQKSRLIPFIGPVEVCSDLTPGV